MTKEKLNVNFCGLDFKNPIVAASGTVGYGREIEQFFPLSILGGICVKGTTKEKRLGNPSPRVAEVSCGILNSVGLENDGIEKFINFHLPYLLKKETKIIVNIAGGSLDEYEYIAQRLDSTNVDMVELNISCPNVKKGGMVFGTDPKEVEKVVLAVRKKTKKPLVVKLSPNVTSIVDIAKAAEFAGADAICLINTLKGMKIDIKTKRPVLKNNVGGLSGPCILPIAVRMVWEVGKVVSIPLIGCGGVFSFEDVLELILAGASLVQIGTVLFNDPLAPIKILKDLNLWLCENNVKRIVDLIGGCRDW